MPFYKKILCLSDNQYLVQGLQRILSEKRFDADFTFCRSITRNDRSLSVPKSLQEIDINADKEFVAKNFDLILSLHCKQIFSTTIVNSIKCINVHPGYNPYNRGWFPQVFSINNKLPLGVTIHEMDEKIDHGKIIAQEQIPVFPEDDSLRCYNRILQKELEMLELHLGAILDDTYTCFQPSCEGTLNLKSDYEKLCKLDLSEMMSMGKAIDRLRSLTHADYNNAYFKDENGNTIYVKIILEKV